MALVRGICEPLLTCFSLVKLTIRRTTAPRSIPVSILHRFTIHDIESRSQYLITMTLSVCWEASEECVPVHILENTYLTRLPCDMQADFIPPGNTRFTISSVLKRRFFFFQNNSKNLDPSYKMDQGFEDCLGRENTILYSRIL